MWKKGQNVSLMLFKLSTFSFTYVLSKLARIRLIWSLFSWFLSRKWWAPLFCRCRSFRFSNASFILSSIFHSGSSGAWESRMWTAWTGFRVFLGSRWTRIEGSRVVIRQAHYVLTGATEAGSEKRPHCADPRAKAQTGPGAWCRCPGLRDPTGARRQVVQHESALQLSVYLRTF